MIGELDAPRDRRRARLVALQNDALNMRGVLSPNGEARKVPMPLGDTLTPAVEWLVNRVAELEAERHTTNQALSDAAEALRANRDRIAELEAAPTTGYRAAHPDSGIILGHYSNEAAARAHCEAEERRAWSSSSSPRFDWIEDEEDGVAEMTAWVGGEETTTGYIVTAVELASEYDEEADE
ncbi:hypothetical protein [Streptomyces griseoluteus]|uniref:hypothetical protein n=1 Tax=Streptomyces griseoluteus TaxID=29306 RepID=UPI0038091BE8